MVPTMRWTVHGRRELYASQWMTLSLVDVEVPGGDRYEHHEISGPEAAGALVADPYQGVLMIWRHRVLSDQWGWEIPGGMIDDGETPEVAARRECIEESGWDPGPMQRIQRFLPIAGQSTQTFWVCRSEAATEVGEPLPSETERVEWHDDASLRAVMARNEVLDAMSVIAIWAHLAGVGRSAQSG